jgi:hypothetical protein
MKYTLLACVVLLSGCAGMKKLPVFTKAQHDQQVSDITYWAPAPAPADSVPHTKPPVDIALPPIAAPDSLPFVAVTRKATILDKLLKRTPKTTYYPGFMPVKAGKKSTVNIYNAPATVTNTSVGKKATAATAEGATVTKIDKVKAPTAIGDSATATDNSKAGQRGGAAAIGAGSTATATTQKGSWPWWAWLLALGGSGYVGYRLYKNFTTV